jgi:hypothetical protein
LAKNMSTMSKYRPMSPVRASLLALRPTGMMAGPTATVEGGDQQTLQEGPTSLCLTFDELGVVVKNGRRQKSR